MGCGTSKNDIPKPDDKPKATAAAVTSQGTGATVDTKAPAAVPTSQLSDVQGNPVVTLSPRPASASSAGSSAGLPEGEDPDAEEKAKDKKRIELLNKLHTQIRWNRLEEVRTLIQGNVNPPINDPDPRNGNTCIHIAAQNGHIDIVKTLVANGAEVNVKNGGGQTPLHMSVSYDIDEVSDFLRASGADETITNEDGHIAKWGLSGEKNPESGAYKLDKFREATDTAGFLETLEAIKHAGSGSGLEVATVAKAALAKKKEYKDQWTPDVQKKLGEVMSSL